MADEEYLLNFINAYYDKELGWKEASKQLILEEELLEKYKDKLDWDSIFARQSLSQQFS